MIVEPGEGRFYKLRRQPPQVTKVLKVAVPTLYRFFKDGTWFVHESYLLDVVKAGHQQGHVDYSALSDSWQIKIAMEKKYWTHDTPKFEMNKGSSLSESYSTLYLTPDAPVAIVEAVWRALAKQHHPDKGGDAEEFKKFSTAYHHIKESV